MTTREDAKLSTRERLLAAARSLFAEKGFYGASLALIAKELSVTKQTLLHHFTSKEQLYAEVLVEIAKSYLQLFEQMQTEHEDPRDRLEAVVLALGRGSPAEMQNARIVMRELLDNQHRADRVKNWYLRPWLDALTDTVLEIPSERRATREEALATVYLILGAANFFAMSAPTLRGMFGKKDFQRLETAYPEQLIAFLRTRFGARWR
ncbi:MAG: helix-turn-helix domain-containing protein [Pseudomonadota bacterium]